MASPVADPLRDPRWQALQAGTAVCPGCGERHRGLFDIAFAAPAPWKGTGAQEPNSAIPDAPADGRDTLTEDLCLQGEHRVLRPVLMFPIPGTRESLAFRVRGTMRHDPCAGMAQMSDILAHAGHRFAPET